MVPLFNNREVFVHESIYYAVHDKIRAVLHKRGVLFYLFLHSKNACRFSFMHAYNIILTEKEVHFFCLNLTSCRAIFNSVENQEDIIIKFVYLGHGYVNLAVLNAQWVKAKYLP